MGQTLKLNNHYETPTPIFKTDYSDHYSIFCVTDLVISAQKNKFVNKCDFSQTIFPIFIKLVINMSGIKYILITIKINFQSVFSKCFMNNFPMKTTKIQYRNRLPYITSGLRKSIQYKHILRHIYAKNPTDENKQKCRTFNNKADMSKSWKVKLLYSCRTTACPKKSRSY